MCNIAPWPESFGGGGGGGVVCLVIREFEEREVQAERKRAEWNCGRPSGGWGLRERVKGDNEFFGVVFEEFR